VTTIAIIGVGTSMFVPGLRMGTRATCREAETPAPRDLPLAWCRLFGRGRCFYTALGHFATAWEDSNYVRHVLGGVEWVLGAGSPDPAAADR
jgi:type 1 glutamine amidotransferase